MPEIFDHLRMNVSDLARARAFYTAALAPLGLAPVEGFVSDKAVGFGKNRRPYFFITAGARMEPRLHLAFAAPSPAEVDAFHAAAMAAGGTDNGKPGIRPYHPTYYGAFVLDPDGHNIEAVHHG